VTSTDSSLPARPTHPFPLIASGCAMKGAPASKISDETAAAIYAARPPRQADGMYSAAHGPSPVVVGKHFNASYKVIRDIWNRRTWVRATQHLWTPAEVLHYQMEQNNVAPVGPLAAIKRRPGRPRGAKDSTQRFRRRTKRSDEGSAEELDQRSPECMALEGLVPSRDAPMKPATMSALPKQTGVIHCGASTFVNPARFLSAVPEQVLEQQDLEQQGLQQQGLQQQGLQQQGLQWWAPEFSQAPATLPAGAVHIPTVMDLQPPIMPFCTGSIDCGDKSAAANWSQTRVHEMRVVQQHSAAMQAMQVPHRYFEMHKAIVSHQRPPEDVMSHGQPSFCNLGFSAPVDDFAELCAPTDLLASAKVTEIEEDRLTNLHSELAKNRWEDHRAEQTYPGAFVGFNSKMM